MDVSSVREAVIKKDGSSVDTVAEHSMLKSGLDVHKIATEDNEWVCLVLVGGGERGCGMCEWCVYSREYGRPGRLVLRFDTVHKGGVQGRCTVDGISQCARGESR